MKTIVSKKTIDSNGRIHWVDGVKGISIYLIMVGHLLNSSNDVVLNGMIVGYWKDGLENEIIPLPKPVIFPFKPNDQKVIQKNQFEIKDNKDEMKTVQTTLYYQEEEKEEKDFWGDLLEEEEEESEEEELF